MRRSCSLMLLLLLSLCAGAADVRFDPKAGTRLPMDAQLRDESDRPVTLSAVMAGTPWILILDYFNCPNLCDTVRADLLVALRGVPANEPYRVAAISIDARESAADAREARLRDAVYSASAETWHYLRTDAATLSMLTATVGFQYRKDSASGQFAHPSGLIFVTSQGTVAGYLLGVGYSSEAVTRNLRDAARDRITPAAPAQIALICFDYDAATGRYTFAIIKLLRVIAIASVLVISGGLVALFRSRRVAA